MPKKPTRNEKDPFGFGKEIASQDFERFLKTRGPLYAFQSLNTFLVHGITPPHELLDFLNQGFATYSNHQGAKSLGECFGLVGKKGKRSLFTQQKQEIRDYHLCREVWNLKTLFGFTLEEAANLVSQFSDSGASISEETIADLWKKNKKWKSTREIMDSKEKGLQSWYKKSGRLWYLGRYPIESLPEKFQKLHPCHPNHPHYIFW